MINFGNRIKEARTKRNWTLEYFAEKLDIAENTIRGYEKSRRTPSLEMLVRICEVLQVSPDFLLQDELSYNPYQAKKEVLAVIDSLTTEQYSLFMQFISSLKK